MRNHKNTQGANTSEFTCLGKYTHTRAGARGHTNTYTQDTKKKKKHSDGAIAGGEEMRDFQHHE